MNNEKNPIRFFKFSDGKQNLQFHGLKVEVKSVCKQTVCLHFELLYFLKI
jgi:hypothetical protein